MECKELPMCIGGCRLAKFKETGMRVFKAKGGMSLEDRINTKCL